MQGLAVVVRTLGRPRPFRQSTSNRFFDVILSAMLRVFLGWIGIAVAGTGYLLSASQGSPAAALQPVSSHRTVLNRYCVTCHNEKLRTAGLLLDKLDVEKVSASPAVWEKVVRKLRANAMPPAGLPRPDQATYDSLAAYL